MDTEIEWRRRVDRILLSLSERAGLLKNGLGPMDPSTRAFRNQVALDLAQIQAEQREPTLETRT